jgi:flagellar hook-associated protein 1 FlgK
MSLLGIGLTGLQVTQTQLQVTGNNISNAQVPGYSRQRTDIATMPEQFRGYGYLGSGVNIQDINRISEQFVLEQVRLDTSTYQNMETLLRNYDQLDGLLADDFSGLGPNIESFFSAIETGVEDPTAMPSRQLVISEIGALVERFNTLDDRINQQNAALNDQLESYTSQISTLATSIAELNRSIEEKGATGNTPNGLLDQRDEFLRQLSELVSVRTNSTSTGAVDVFIGNGQPLVTGTLANQMGVQTAIGSTDQEVVFVSQTGNQIVTKFISGGQLGGVLEFRDDVLSDALNQLGRIALTMSDSLNKQNREGLDLDGNYGGNLFGDINTTQKMQDRVSSNSKNVGTGAVSIRIDDTNLLTTNDYRLLLSGGSPADYNVLDSKTGQTIASGTLTGTIPEVISGIDGFSISLDSGTFPAGDSFTIQPTRHGARDITQALSRPQGLAYALPLRIEDSLGNSGSGLIENANVLNVYDPSTGLAMSEFGGGAAPAPLSTPILIRFTSTTSFDVLDNSNPALPTPLFLGNAFTPGQANTVNFGSAYQIDLNGYPDVGDEFTISHNAGAVSDNRNAVAMGALRTLRTMDNGALDFEDAYGHMLEDIGSETAQARISRESSFSLLQQSQNQRESISGVSLDEEAANLIKFEQAYNASAQIINVARQIFDTLLSAFR